MWSDMMNGALAVRDAADAGQFFDLPFGELVADPVAAVQCMYAHFSFERSAEAERAMAAWHADNPQGKHGGHQYAAADFGLSEGEIAERFAPYLERFQVARE